MKNYISKLFAIVFIFSCATTFSQETEVKHLPESRDLVGLWQYIVPQKNNDNIEFTALPLYKVFNSDNTFYGFGTGFRKEANTEGAVINYYGTYEITSDSTFVETLKYHFSKTFNSQSSQINFVLLSDHLMGAMLISPTGDKTTEFWMRVPKANEEIIFPDLTQPQQPNP